MKLIFFCLIFFARPLFPMEKEEQTKREEWVTKHKTPNELTRTLDQLRNERSFLWRSIGRNTSDYLVYIPIIALGCLALTIERTYQKLKGVFFDMCCKKHQGIWSD